MKVFAALILLAMLPGCATGPATTPAEVVEAHLAALQRGDLAAAHALLEPRERARAPRLVGGAWAAAATGAQEVSRTAVWPGEGEELTVVRGAQGWQIAAGVLGLFVAQTPEQALATLARAIMARDYEALLALVPRAERAEWTATELAAVLDVEPLRGHWVALAQALSGGGYDLMWIDRARVRVALGEAAVVTLVREGNGWRVFDVAPSALYTQP